MTLLTPISAIEDAVAELRALPGVTKVVVTEDASGWVTCDPQAHGPVLTCLRTWFGAGPRVAGMFMGASGARILMIDTGHTGPLPPGFAAVPFVGDAAERALVDTARDRTQRLQAQLDVAATGDLPSIAQALRHLLACLFWRDLDLPVGLQPSGPWQTVATRIGPDREVLKTCVRDTRALLVDQHGTPGNATPTPPVWYTNAEAEAYDQHRHLPADVGPRLARIFAATSRRHVTELGAGTGRVARALRDANARVSLTLTDNAPAMLDRLRAAFDGDGAIIRHGRMDDLATLAKGADAILEHEVFFLHPNPARLSRILARALNENRILVRLERHSEPDLPLKRMCDQFETSVALALGSPVGFVGEGIFDRLDAELQAHGLQTRRFRGLEQSRTITRAAFAEARRARAFPYLAHVPQTGLLQAIDRAIETTQADRFTVTDRYDIAVTGCATALASLTQVHP
ncbi:MAG: class I SAM-dependent methyltransferase [Tateyamaria sp.]